MKYLKIYKLFTEARSVKNYKEYKLDELIRDYVSKYGEDDVYISFRKDLYVTDFHNNPNVGTPIGYYFYPLSKLVDINSVYFPSNYTENIDFFKKYFPYLPKYPSYLDIFTLGDLDKINVLTKYTNKDKLNQYVNKIKDKYNNNKIIVNICNSYLNRIDNNIGDFYDLIIDISHNMGTGAVYHRSKRLCNELGINGFIDYGDSFIYEGEPVQGVLFKVKGFVKDSYSYFLNEKFSKDLKYSFQLFLNKLNNINVDSISDEEFKNYESKLYHNMHSYVEKYNLSENDLIYDIILKYPNLIHFIKDKNEIIRNFNQDKIIRLIQKNPILTDNFDCEYLTDENKEKILRTRPTLKDKLSKEININEEIDKFIKKPASFNLEMDTFKKEWFRLRYNQLISDDKMIRFLKIFPSESKYIDYKRYYELYKDKDFNSLMSETVKHFIKSLIEYKKNNFSVNELKLIKKPYYLDFNLIIKFFINNPEEIKNIKEYNFVNNSNKEELYKKLIEINKDHENVLFNKD